jgi:hypothetical protein
MTWQPIETAPKDRPVLLWRSDADVTEGGAISIGVMGATGKWAAMTDGDLIDEIKSGSTWTYIDGPTHWMPLPAPPANPVDAGTETG